MNRTFRTPKHYRTPLSKKQENIQSFGRLLELAKQKTYHGPRLDDQTVRGLAVCVYTWLLLNNFECELQDDVVVVQFDDGPFVIRSAGTHRSHPHYPDIEFSDDHELTIYNLMGFLNWYDSNLKT